MRKLTSILLAAVLAGSGLTGLASARDNHRGHGDRDRYVSSYCADHPRARDCLDWRRNGRSWNDSAYRGFYERNRRDDDSAAIAALFGIIVGAAIASGAEARRDSGYRSDENWRHGRACAARYRSYDRQSDTYLARNGRRYYCNL